MNIFSIFSLTFLIISGTKAFSLEAEKPSYPEDCNPMTYDSLFPVEAELTLALDNFRSLPEGNWEGNTGAFFNVDLKTLLAKSYLLQLAGSYGVYDWAGRTSTPFKNSKVFQQQGFLTGAVSRETPCLSGINVGFAYDCMFNKNFGVFAVNPFMSQIRGQIGYSIKGGNEIGAWGTFNTNTSHKETNQIPLRFHAISQANLFWCHYFKNNSYGMIWAGTPYRRGLMYTSGRAGRYIFGARFQAVLTHSLSITGHAAYMGARSAPNGNESRYYAANVCFGLTYSLGYRNAKETPYMTSADNSNFLVDTNLNL